MDSAAGGSNPRPLCPKHESRTMNEQTRSTLELVRALVSSYILHPKKLLLEGSEVDGRVYFEMRAAFDDQPKLIGKQGSHIKALRFILREIGLGQEVDYNLTLLEPIPGARGEPEKPKPVSFYETKEAHELLERAAQSLVRGQVRVDCARIPGDRPCSFLFTITPRDLVDYADLITADDDDPEEQTVIGSLGTLFRAFANKAGVQFKIDVKKP